MSKNTVHRHNNSYENMELNHEHQLIKAKTLEFKNILS